MKLISPADFRAERAWGALDIARIDGATVRLHWTDAPYRWHANDGAEVFDVLDADVVERIPQRADVADAVVEDGEHGGVYQRITRSPNGRFFPSSGSGVSRYHSSMSHVAFAFSTLL